MKSMVLFEKDNSNELYTRAHRAVRMLLTKSNIEQDEYGLIKNGIKTCTGCFGCWVRTPGECVLKDAGNDIAAKVISSDMFVILTSVRFGSYSYVMKQAVDRLIPLISPFFKTINGETHHRKRYKHYPVMLPIGVLNTLNTKEEEIFVRLAERNQINFFSGHTPATVVKNGDENRIDDKIYSGLKGVL